MGKSRVLLVDDSPDFLKMVSKFFASVPEVELIGAVLTGQDAITLATELRPDLILMDLVMPKINGLEATRRIKAMPDPPIVIILTGHDTPEYRRESAGAGADGFVHKPALFVELLPLMRRLTNLAADKKP